MAVHNNVYIPKESWPNWTWYAIEFFIVLATSLLISNEVMPAFDPFEIDETNLNYIFWSITGSIFLGWYLLLRRLIIKKPILENRY